MMFYSILPVITLIIGFYFGFRIGKEKEIPKVNPIETIKENVEIAKEEKKAKKDKKILDQYIENLDNYPNNQKPIKE